MQVLALDINQIHRPADIAKTFQKSGLQKGDTVRVLTNEETTLALIAVGILILVALDHIFRSQSEAPHAISDEILAFNSPEDIQAEAAHDYGISLEFESRKPNQALEGLFGLWADHDVSIESIRQKSWQRHEQQV